MKNILIICSVILMTPAFAKTTLQAGLAFDTVGEVGFTAGGNWFHDNSKKLTFGFETGISYWDIEVATLTIIELMPMVRYGDRLFVDFGLGIEHNIAKVGSKTYSDMKSGVGVNAGFEMADVIVCWRYRLVQTTSLFGFTLGYRL